MDSKQQRILARQAREPQASVVNVACVIHGTLYSWDYVERLYTMVTQNLTGPVQFHVFTEESRPVPPHMIKHVLQEWDGISGKKKAWWYKMQLFNPKNFSGQLLYFDLDTVITRSLDWITTSNRKLFWTIRDFRYLWRPTWQGMNSSVMYWDTERFAHVWQDFSSRNLQQLTRQYYGDQDYLDSVIDQNQRSFFDDRLVKSWRWQVKDGGMDMKSRVYLRPAAGSILDPITSIVIFHGTPKPHEVYDPFIDKYWRTITSQ
jgi:hypothetical protein